MNEDVLLTVCRQNKKFLRLDQKNSLQSTVFRLYILLSEASGSNL